MDLVKSLSSKDFFNYYFAGMIWLIDFVLVIRSLPGQPDPLASIAGPAALPEVLVAGILAFVLPYVLGFALNQPGNMCAGLIYRLCGDPIDWIADNKAKGNLRIPKPAAEKIDELASKIFGYSLDDKRLWFFQIRSYVEYKGGAAGDLARRAHDLANLSESLLVPIPLLSVLLGFTLSDGMLSIVSLGGIALAAVTFLSLTYRHLKLREYWGKHVYRAFLVLEADVH